MLCYAKMTYIPQHFGLINRITFRGTVGLFPSSSIAGNEFAKDPQVWRVSRRTSPLTSAVPITLIRPLVTWPCTRIHSPLAQSYHVHVQSRSYSNAIVQSTASYRTAFEHYPGFTGKIALSLVANTRGFLHTFPYVSHNVFKHYSTNSSEGAKGISEKEMKKEMDELTDQFMETRELLADAMETKGSVYFDEDLQEAKQSLDETLERYRTLLSKLNEEQERAVVRTIGLKMDELKAQEAMIMEQLKED